MKTLHAIVIAPIVFGALGACSHARPGPADDMPIAAVAAPEPAAPVGPDLRPDFGAVVQQAEPPPPISGGTLTMAPDGKTAIAADTDRDRVYIVDLHPLAVRRTVQLAKHSEPGRVAVDNDGHAYVVLRRSGGLATIDLATGALSIRDVCVAPRGLAFDEGHVAIHVACANGELVTVPVGPTAGAADALERRVLDRDLRDVIVQNDGSMLVTTFRSAAKIRVRREGSPTTSSAPATSVLAWRAIAVPGPKGEDGCKEDDCSDRTATVQQRQPAPTYYGATNPADATNRVGAAGAGRIIDPELESSSCGAATTVVTTELELGSGSVSLPEAVLPVDLAAGRDQLAVVAAGNAFTRRLPQIFVVAVADVKQTTNGACVNVVHGNVPGQAIAAAFAGDDALIVQTREPAALHIMTRDRRAPWKTISLATDSVADTGHAVFHANSGSSVACASCHAEGGDDGLLWAFGSELRRTPSLRGTVAGTEPFHWDGDEKTMRDLVDHVFVQRMGGPQLDEGHLGALSGWLNAVPPLPKLGAPSEITARGAIVFEQRCTSCHAGKMLTNNATVDVGTGGAFQVPSLVGVGWRASFIHTACAKTLTQRFDPSCGGAYHGDTGSLSKDQVQDLVQFLETL